MTKQKFRSYEDMEELIRLRKHVRLTQLQLDALDLGFDLVPRATADAVVGARVQAGGVGLPEFRKNAQLSQARFAELMTVSGFPATQALVSQWESGAVELTAERCAQIERVTDGQVTRIQLRPDLFGPLQPAEPVAGPVGTAVSEAA